MTTSRTVETINKHKVKTGKSLFVTAESLPLPTFCPTPSPFSTILNELQDVFLFENHRQLLFPALLPARREVSKGIEKGAKGIATSSSWPYY